MSLQVVKSQPKKDSGPLLTLTATAVEVHRGGTLATYRVEVTRGDGKVCGTFTGTVLIKR